MGHHHLQEFERGYIEKYLKEKKTPYEIAKLLGRSPSTIYREIKKGTVKLLDSHLKEYSVYLADTGQLIHNQNALNKGRPINIDYNLALSNRLEELIILEHYSPYSALIIAANEGYNVNISLNTLYSYIHKGGVFLYLNDSHLRYSKKRKKKKQHINSVAHHNLAHKSIELRPDISSRSSYGHWELDTVYSGKKQKTCLFVLTERLTRQELVFKKSNRSSDCCISVLDDLEHIYRDKFSFIFRSITCDNGVEFLDPERMERSVFDSSIKRTNIFYCHPYSSYERGSNENANKLIRRFIPKGADIGSYSDDFIQYIQEYINTMPRKIFGGKSSLDMVHEFGFS